MWIDSRIPRHHGSCCCWVFSNIFGKFLIVSIFGDPYHTARYSEWGFSKVIDEHLYGVFCCGAACSATKLHVQNTQIAAKLPLFGVSCNSDLPTGNISLASSEYSGSESREESHNKHYVAELVKPIAMLCGGLGFSVIGFWQWFAPKWDTNGSFVLGVIALLISATSIISGGIWLSLVLWPIP